MLGTVKTILSRLNTRPANGVTDACPRGQTSISDGNKIAEGPATDDSDVTSPSHLYERPSCDQVYVATDERTCSTCDIAVGRIEETD